MNTMTLHPTCCAICQTGGNATELYPSNLKPEAFHSEIFSARRLPDRIHYRIVRCNTCGLVRSDPIADSALVSELYAQSTFNYGNEIENIKSTYGKYLAKITAYHVKKDALLEIGCGNGFFLEEAINQGYTTVAGVEPSVDAVAKAEPLVRSHIVCDNMRPGLFKTEQFDVICLFQVLDHIPDPGALLDECFKILRPGGIMLCFNHNVEALSSKLFKHRSPIIDIEHTYLYSPITLAQLFSKFRFQVRKVDFASNRYTLSYLTRLAPFSAGFKRLILGVLKHSAIGKRSLSLPLGNLYVIAQKPD